MNVLILKFPYSSTFGGGEKHTLKLIELLSPRGFKFFLVSTCPVLMGEFNKRNLPNRRILAGREPVTPMAAAFFPLWAPFFLLELIPLLIYYRLFKKCRRLYCLSLTEKFLAAPIAWLLGYKVIWVEHVMIDNWLSKNPLRFLYRRGSKFATVVAVSHAIRKQLLEMGVDGRRIVTIHHGVDFKEFPADIKPSPRYQRTFVVGTVCRLSPEKGLPILLQSIKIAQDVIPNLSLVIVGDGPEKNSLLWLTKNLGVENRVKFVGWQDNLARWMINFDLFVLPSVKREAFGLVLLEAMALGKPVVASRIGGIPEVVEHGQTGVLVESSNPEMLAQEIINLYNDPDRLKLFGENGRKRVIEQFAIEKMADKFYGLLA